MKTLQKKRSEAMQRAEARAKRTTDEQMKLILSRRGHSGREIIRLANQSKSAAEKRQINKGTTHHG